MTVTLTSNWTQPLFNLNEIMAQFYAVIYPEKACKEAGEA